MIFLYFIRHLPTISNIEQLWCGLKTDLDIDISAANKLKKAGTLDRIINKQYDYIFSSPLKRCTQTSKFLKLNPKLIKLDERLVERDFGLIEQTNCDNKTKLALANWNLNTDLGKNVERIQDMYYKKVLPFLNDIKKMPNNSHILIVSHSWIGRLLRYYFTGDTSVLEIAPKNCELLTFCLSK